MNLKIKENLTSTTFWIAASAFVLLMLHTFGVNVVDAKYNAVFNGVLGLLTMIGILNAPQSQNKIEDKTAETITSEIAQVEAINIDKAEK